MNKLLMETLSTLNIPVLYGIRGDKKPPCVVFNYYEEPLACSCDDEELTKFKILLNIYEYGDFTEQVKKVDLLMRQGGFTRVIKPSAFYNDALTCWVQPIEYIKILESELI